MSLLKTIETGLSSLLGHRLRSVLTTLGILFGVYFGFNSCFHRGGQGDVTDQQLFQDQSAFFKIFLDAFGYFRLEFVSLF